MTEPRMATQGTAPDSHVVRDKDFAIQTFEYEGLPDVVAIESLKIEDLGGGRTRLVGDSVDPTVEARDGMVTGNMEGGMSEGYERLDEVVAGLSVSPN